MREILLPVENDPTTTISFSFDVGSQDDPPGKEGLAALTASLVTQGATRKLSYDEILERLYPLATDYDACVDKELVTIGGRVHRDKLDDYIELLGDALLDPAFREEDFERVKDEATSFVGTTLRYASDEELGKAALAACTFAGTRYAHPVEGTLSGLGSIELDDLRSFYASHFTQARLTLGIAGAIPGELTARLSDIAGRLPLGSAFTRPVIARPELSGRRVVLVDKPGADASISFGLPLAVARGQREFYALWLANSWLGEHRHGASHLFQVIREARGLNYGDYSYIEAFPDGGMLQMPPVNVPRRHQLFEVWIRTLPNEQAVFALRAALREIENLVENGMTPDQFELTRKFLSKYSTHYAPTTAARLGFAIDDAFYGVEDPGHLDRLKATLADLELEEVNSAIKRHWTIKNLVIAIVTGDARGLANQLASDQPTPISYANSMPESILAEDESIAGYALDIAGAAIETWPIESVFD